MCKKYIKTKKTREEHIGDITINDTRSVRFPDDIAAIGMTSEELEDQKRIVVLKEYNIKI